MSSILVDICHPAHVHFFRHPVALWESAGHKVHIASREKDVAVELLDALGLQHTPLGRAASSPLGLGLELLTRDVALWRLARSTGAEVVTAIGGTFAAHAAWLSGIPSVVFYDTEIARWQNRLTYPLASRVIVPRCYSGPVPKARTTRYAGYHELSYLHPARFRPDRERAIRAGLAPEGDTYLVRLVSWTANHDVGETGLAAGSVERMVQQLGSRGRVVISSEADLPPSLDQLRFRGAAEDMHHLMSACAGYFGESATMASECAMLGVPAVYAANSHRGYTDELESRYGLVKNVRQLTEPALREGVEWLVSVDRDRCTGARQRMIDETVDVAAFAADAVVDAMRLGRHPKAESRSHP